MVTFYLIRKFYSIFFVCIDSLDGYGIGYVDTGDSDSKPRNLAIHSVRRLLFWTDVEQQSIFRSRLDGSDRMTLAVLDGNAVIAVDPILNLVFFAHGKRIDMMDINGKNK
jgi:low density lipoprotein receptor-related protein 5/6